MAAPLIYEHRRKNPGYPRLSEVHHARLHRNRGLEYGTETLSLRRVTFEIARDSSSMISVTVLDWTAPLK